MRALDFRVMTRDYNPDNYIDYKRQHLLSCVLELLADIEASLRRGDTVLSDDDSHVRLDLKAKLVAKFLRLGTQFRYEIVKE